MEETDMLKVLEQVSAMSQMLNPEGGEAQGEWLEKMTAMVNVMKLMKTLQPPQESSKISEPLKPGASAQDIRNSDARDVFDASIQTPALRTIKAAIPHLDYRYQKKLGIMVKLLEIQKLLEIYNERINVFKDRSGDNWQRNMLQAIHPHVPQEKQYMLELLIKMMDIKEILKNMQKLQDNKYREVKHGP